MIFTMFRNHGGVAHRHPGLRATLFKALTAAIWLGCWAAASAAVGQTLLLPSPLETAGALATFVRQSAFWISSLLSVGRIFCGFAAGLLIGGALAVLTSRSAWWRGFFSPVLSAAKATPVASFILLALVWIRTNGVPVLATMLVVLPVAWANVSVGIQSTSAELLEMARAFGMTARKTLAHVYWPSVRPALRAAVASGMGMAWKAGVAAEIICTPKNALGTLLYDAKIYLDMPALFAGTAVVIALSVALEKLVVLAAYGRGGRRENA